ncbi:N-acetylmuramoyl-L-alanine amidase [Bacillus massilinigeriensis]|uniref:N-acetylmuramoyl-L-alanine amidase n=1 Tax=Bacillus mediterraneensis TaxID=1805474 RepID=UPI0008F90FCC|nr:N-acetylmuramoyl-L-alanine amidase [Bacillus mediterraneensis]
MHSKVLFLLALSLLLCDSVTVAKGPPVKVTITEDNVNIRSGPGMHYNIIEKAMIGNQFSFLRATNEWTSIDLPSGKTGWISNKFIAMPETKKTKEKGKSIIRTVVPAVHIRSKPLNGRILGTIHKGEEYEVIAVRKHWIKLKGNGHRGWAPQWFFEGGTPRINHETWRTSTLNRRRILIDPGHGGKDQGTSGQLGFVEKNLTLQTSRLLYEKLVLSGAEVSLTRYSDYFLPLSERTKKAAKEKADAFISIHYDSSNGSSASGTASYYYYKNQKGLAEKLGDKVPQATGAASRGIKEGNYHVIREYTETAALVELGFLDNPFEEKQIITQQYQHKAVNGIYDGLAGYFDSNAE